MPQPLPQAPPRPTSGLLQLLALSVPLSSALAAPHTEGADHQPPGQGRRRLRALLHRLQELWGGNAEPCGGSQSWALQLGAGDGNCP